jgi:hypothetical protein
MYGKLVTSICVVVFIGQGKGRKGVSNGIDHGKVKF